MKVSSDSVNEINILKNLDRPPLREQQFKTKGQFTLARIITDSFLFGQSRSRTSEDSQWKKVFVFS